MGKTWWLPLVVSFALLGCSEPSPAASGGTYIGRGTGFAVMVQIAKSDGYNFDGAVSLVELAADGKVTAHREPIQGTIDGSAVNFSVIHPSGTSPATTPVSGVVTNQGLQLTFFAKGKATPLSFKKGTAEEFYAFVQAVQEKSRELTSKK